MKLGKEKRYTCVTTLMYKYVCNLPCSIILGIRVFSKKGIDPYIEVNFSA